MATRRHLALLRGINVGGKNIVSMADLRRAFEEHGYGAVSTYINSGNVLFESSGGGAPSEAEVEAMLERSLGVPLVVVLRSHRQLANVVAKAPKGFGARPGTHHSDVIFLKKPLTPAAAVKVIVGNGMNDEVDQVWPGTGVVYAARLSARASESRLGRIIGKPEYQQMTIRSWSTTTKLLARFDERVAG